MSWIWENIVLDYSDVYHFVTTTELLVSSGTCNLRQAYAKEPVSAYWACSAEAAKAAFFCDLQHVWRFSIHDFRFLLLLFSLTIPQSKPALCALLDALELARSHLPEFSTTDVAIARLKLASLLAFISPVHQLNLDDSQEISSLNEVNLKFLLSRMK